MSAPGPRVKQLENFLRPLLSVLDPGQHLSRGARIAPQDQRRKLIPRKSTARRLFIFRP